MELIQKKEELLSMISSQAKETAREKQPKRIARSTVATVSASRLDDGEVVIQVSTSKVHETALSEILLNLEEDGLLLLNASSFESSGGRVSYTLHLQVCFCNISFAFAFSILIKYLTSYKSTQIFRETK